jgi:hypothetical protein
MTPKPKKEICGTILVEVETITARYLYLHQQLAHGKNPDGGEFDVSIDLSNGDYLISSGGVEYRISMREIVTKVLDLQARKRVIAESREKRPDGNLDPGEDGAIPGFDIPLAQTEFPEPERY